MRLIKINEETIIDNEIDYIITYINIILLLLKIYISQSAKVLLAYYILDGVSKNTHKKLVELKFSSSIQAVIGLRGELKRKKILIKKEDDKFYLREEFNIGLTDKIFFQWEVLKKLDINMD